MDPTSRGPETGDARPFRALTRLSTRRCARQVWSPRSASARPISETHSVAICNKKRSTD